jgi:hypothetical protein
MTGHCPHCGEPVMLVPISTLVASERQVCSCDVQPDLVGPDDPFPERQPSRLPDPLRRDQDAVAAAIEEIPGETILDESSEHSARSPGEPTATRSSNR